MKYRARFERARHRQRQRINAPRNRRAYRRAGVLPRIPVSPGLPSGSRSRCLSSANEYTPVRAAAISMANGRPSHMATIASASVTFVREGTKVGSNPPHSVEQQSRSLRNSAGSIVWKRRERGQRKLLLAHQPQGRHRLVVSTVTAGAWLSSWATNAEAVRPCSKLSNTSNKLPRRSASVDSTAGVGCL